MTPSEQSTIAAIALEHDATVCPLRAEKTQLAQNFRQQMLPGNRHVDGTPAPATPPSILALRRQIINQELAARDKIHQALGDARFAHLDAVLRAYAQHDFKTLIALKGGAQ